MVIRTLPQSCVPFPLIFPYLGGGHSSRSSFAALRIPMQRLLHAQQRLYHSKVTLAIPSNNQAENQAKKDILNGDAEEAKEEERTVSLIGAASRIPVSRFKELLKLIRFDKPIGSL